MSDLVKRLREVRREVEALTRNHSQQPERALIYRRAVLAILDRHIAALDAQPVGLDVERLAKAMDNLYERRWGRGVAHGQTTVNLEYAGTIAAEYAALASEPQP